MNLENYIEDLSPELQEKARACGSVEELLALAKEAQIPVPDEALEAIAGGEQPDPENCKRITCPKCGSTKVDYYPKLKIYLCERCGYEWQS